MSHSVNRLIANHTNLVRDALISASAQRPSADIRLIEQARTGRGGMALSGPYQGATDTLVEIEIINGGGSALRTSTPIIAGVGNGTLSVSAVDSLAVPETVTFRLASTGSPATHAELPFYGVTLRARVAGAAGNALSLSVERRLELGAPVGATLSELAAGVTDLPGATWDFGATTTSGSGIPLDAPRLVFAGFPQVHRQWRAWVDGAWVYRLDPAPAYAIPTDTPVHRVTGDYRLTLTNGVITETYDAITLFDFLTAVQSRSALVEVVGLVLADTAPGGQAVTDIPLRTDAYALPVIAEISTTEGARQLQGVSISPTAVTENITVTARANTAAAPARWAVQGGASGTLPDAITGVPYSAGPVAFVIPDVPMPPELNAPIRARFQPASRGEGEGTPSVCIKPLTLGARASAKTITFTYTRRPVMDCCCDSLPAPRLTAACLGLAEGGNAAVSLDPSYQSALEELYRWRADFMWGQVDFSSPQNPLWSQQDMDLCDQVVESFARTLEQIYLYPDALAGWHAEFYQFKLQIEGLAGVSEGAKATQDIAPGLAVGAMARHPLTRHVYMLKGVVKRDNNAFFSGLTFTTNPVETTSPTLDEEIDLEAWPSVVGQSFTKTTVYVWHTYSIDDESHTTPQLEEISTWTCIATADAIPDLSSTASVDQIARRYTARMDYILTLAGIVPKSDANSSSGDGCWRERTDAAYHWVDESGAYLPAYTNEAYISSVIGCSGAPVSTQEFGFGLVVDCAERLKEGDKITLTLEGATQGPYAEGDRFTIPVIGAAPARWTGGVEGDATHTWAVSGSSGGAYPDWLWDPADPDPYTAGPLDCTLSPGGIPFEQGDQIRVALEGGRLRWRRDSGDWTEADLYAASHDLGDGLTLVAAQGAAPSFVAGDTWRFRAAATWGVDRLRQPRERAAFGWDGEAVTLDLDLGLARDLGAVLLAHHSLPGSASIIISGGESAPDAWSATPAWSAGPILAPLPEGTRARYLRLSITGAGSAGADIGWLWAGQPWAPSASVSALQHVRQYGLTRSGGRNPRARYSGRGTGGRWSWSLAQGGALTDADLTGLLALLDHVAEQGLEWVCLVPDIRDPASAALAQIEADAVTITEELGYYLEGGARLHSVELPFRAVLQ